MTLLRSLRSLSIVAILAALLMALLPAGGFASTSMAQNGAMAAEKSDCAMCPKADMVMVNCAQTLCGLTSTEPADVAAVIVGPTPYALVRVDIPLGRHTVPPVSPG